VAVGFLGPDRGDLAGCDQAEHQGDEEEGQPEIGGGRRAVRAEPAERLLDGRVSGGIPGRGLRDRAEQ
jgi:hypothetical protein